MSAAGSLLGRAKKLVHDGLDRYAAGRLQRQWEDIDAGLVIMGYHRVLPANSAELACIEPGMYVSTDTFAAHLEFLQSSFEAVDLADWLERRAAGGKLPKRAFAVTFDDGWRDNYEYAFPLLRKSGVPATIFVVSGLVGTRYSFWPERLGRILSQGPARHHSDNPWLAPLLDEARVSGRKVSEETISCVVACAKRYPDALIQERLDELEADLALANDGARRDLFDWQELQEMTNSGLVTAGSHTRHHVRLTSDVSDAVMRDEIIGSRKEIADHTGAEPRLFCYPNGDLSAQAEALVRSEYAGACTTARGWNNPGTNVHRLQRTLVHNDRSRTRSALIARIGLPA